MFVFFLGFLIILFFSVVLAFNYDFDGDRDVDGKDLAEFVFQANYNYADFASEFAGVTNTIFYVRNIDGIEYWSSVGCPLEDGINQDDNDGLSGVFNSLLPGDVIEIAAGTYFTPACSACNYSHKSKCCGFFSITV